MGNKMSIIGLWILKISKLFLYEWGMDFKEV